MGQGEWNLVPLGALAHAHVARGKCRPLRLSSMYLLSTCCVPGAVLGVRDIAVSETYKLPTPMELVL